MFLVVIAIIITNNCFYGVFMNYIACATGADERVRRDDMQGILQTAIATRFMLVG